MRASAASAAVGAVPRQRLPVVRLGDGGVALTLRQQTVGERRGRCRGVGEPGAAEGGLRVGRAAGVEVETSRVGLGRRIEGIERGRGAHPQQRLIGAPGGEQQASVPAQCRRQVGIDLEGALQRGIGRRPTSS